MNQIQTECSRQDIINWIVSQNEGTDSPSYITRICDVIRGKWTFGIRLNWRSSNSCCILGDAAVLECAGIRDKNMWNDYCKAFLTDADMLCSGILELEDEGLIRLFFSEKAVQDEFIDPSSGFYRIYKAVQPTLVNRMHLLNSTVAVPRKALYERI